MWRQRANYAKLASINYVSAPVRGQYTHEQLALEKITNDKYIVCCIPFLLYDINLGDTVSFQGNSIHREVDGGRYGFRIFIDAETIDPTLFNATKEVLIQSGASIEYRDDGRLWAIDTLDKSSAAKVSAELQDLVNRHVLSEYETVRTF